MSPVAVAQFFFVGIAIRYILPVSWITSRFPFLDDDWLEEHRSPSARSASAESEVYDCLVGQAQLTQRDRASTLSVEIL